MLDIPNLDLDNTKLRYAAQYLNDFPVHGRIFPLWSYTEDGWTSMIAQLYPDDDNLGAYRSYAAIEFDGNNATSCHHIPARYVDNWNPMSRVRLYACIISTGSPYHKFEITEEN